MKTDVMRSESKEEWADQWIFAEDHIYRLGTQYGQLVDAGRIDDANHIKDAAEAFFIQFSNLETAQWETFRLSLEFTFGVASARPFRFHLPGEIYGGDEMSRVRTTTRRVPRPRSPMVETPDGPQVQML